MNTGPVAQKLNNFFVFIAKISIVIGTAAFLILLVIKIAQCQFYEIPINYSSLDIKSILPFCLFGFILFFGTYFDVIKTEPDKEKTPKPNSFISILSRCLQSIPFVKRIKANIQNIIRTTIIRRKIEIAKNRDFFSSRAQICLPVVMLYSFFLFESTDLLLQDYSCAVSSADVFLAFTINIMTALIIKMKSDRRMIRWGKSIERSKQRLDEIRAKQKAEENGDLFQDRVVSEDENNYENFKIYLHGIFILLFLIEIYLGSGVFFYTQRQYDTFTLDSHDYAIVAFEDDSYVVKPVEITDNIMIINMNQYMYIEKNKVVISRVTYDKVSRTE